MTNYKTKIRFYDLIQIITIDEIKVNHTRPLLLQCKVATNELASLDYSALFKRPLLLEKKYQIGIRWQHDHKKKQQKTPL
jgi:hypothetical protein